MISIWVASLCIGTGGVVGNSVRITDTKAMLIGGKNTCSVDRATRTVPVTSRSQCLSRSLSGSKFPGFNYKTSTDPPTCELFSCLPINFAATENCMYFQISQADFVTMERNLTDCVAVHQKTDQSATFGRSWSEFKAGSRDLHINYYWIGNDRLHELTKDGGYRLRVDLKSINGNWYWAGYNTFIVGDEATKYQLTLGGYVGTAGNSWGSSVCGWGDINGMNFTTFDSDNDAYDGVNCANYGQVKGGFWYRFCGAGVITGGAGSSIGFMWYLIPDAYGRTNNLVFARMTLIKVL